jgi:nucleotide-binding universal stress UspA family protein
MEPFKHILVATDFGPSSAYAVELAVSLASGLDAELTLLHVWEVPTSLYSGLVLNTTEMIKSIERAAADNLDESLHSLRQRLPRVKSTLQMGAPWREIVDAATSKNADLIVMGTHGRQGLSHALLGSVAEKVVRLSTVPVLTARLPTST